MFVIDINYKVGLDFINQHIMEHRAWLDAKYEDGVLLCSGPKEPRTGGVIIALCESKDDAHSLIKEDPFYTNDLVEYTVTEFLSNKYHANIKDLIS